MGTNASEVMCVKKVQKSEECLNMCPEAHSATSNETAVVTFVALPPTVRKVLLRLAQREAGVECGVLLLQPNTLYTLFRTIAN